MTIEERKGKTVTKPSKISMLDLSGTLYREGVRRASDEEIRRSAEQATTTKYRSSSGDLSEK